MSTLDTHPALPEVLDATTQRPANDSFPPSTRSTGTDEDLWPIDPVVEATWNARRGRRRAVQDAGFTAIGLVVGAVLGLTTGSASARGAMVSWGTMGAVSHAAAHVVAAAPPIAAQPLVTAPVVEVPAAPETPAVAEATPTPAAANPAPALAAPTPTAPRQSVARKVVATRDADDPYADAAPRAPAPRAPAKSYLSDPY
jgi:hypothetical protein